MSNERVNYIDCGTHGAKPWQMESMCSSCGRIYRPRQEGQSSFDGPFVEFEGGTDTQVAKCTCGEVMLDFSVTPVEIGRCYRQICSKCFKRDFKFAKRQGIDVNDDKMCRDRLARRAAHGSHN